MEVIKLTSGMITILRVIHNKRKGLQGGLLLKPVPSVFWVICKIIHLPDFVWDNTVRGHEIFRID
jgi:hypothetical protein